MSPTRPTPIWVPWPMRQGNNLPTIFRWRDDGGPVDMTGMELRLRITLFDGTAMDFQAGVDAGFVLLDQAAPASRGMFSFQPTLALTRLLPLEPAARYEFEARHAGIQQTIGEGQIALQPGSNRDA